MPFIEALRPSGRLADLTARATPRQPGSWYTIRDLADGEAEVLLYDEIGWYGTAAEDFVRELRDVQASRLTVRLNSPGGSVFDGIAIANSLRAHPAAVTVQVDSLAASIASVIAMAGDRIVMMPHSQMMIHDASGLAIGDAGDMREMADLLDRQSDNIAAVYAERAGGTVEDWRATMRAETWYTAEEAVAAGLADEMAPARRSGEEPAEPEREPAMAARWDLSVFRYAGREEAPAAAPVASAPTPGLAADIATLVGDQVAAALRAHVAADTETPAEPPAPVEEPAPPAGEEAEQPDPPAEPAPEPAPDPEPVDEWAALVAHITQPDPDPWAELTSHLTSASSAATAA